MARQKVTPFLWFDSNAEEAATFYVSIFPDSAITAISGSTPGGKPLVVEFRLAGVHYSALNGGPYYKLTEAFSLSVDCETQAEVDDLWDKLTEGGSWSRCGWLTDKFGLTWQVVPTMLPGLLMSPDAAKAGRVMQAMLGMTKLDIRALQAAADAQ